MPEGMATASTSLAPVSITSLIVPKASPLSVELRLICGTLLELDGRLHDAAVCYREVVELSTVAQQIRLASQRLLFLNASVGATDGFEDVIAKLVEEGEKEEGNR